MVTWENNLRLSPMPVLRGGEPERALSPAGRLWQARLWRDLLLAGAFYAAAHLTFAVSGMGRGLEMLSPPALTADLLFLLGTLPLWRVTRTLNEPVGQPRQAAYCLALAMGLSFSPCLWWMASRLL
jgi:hypothetical protein